ncbi:MAG: phosphatase PAP2 family protein [Ignavibacteriales bacterium]|nr:MAG: phosphatase PAP2 family protein [Ignavibacteriales bacterium]
MFFPKYCTFNTKIISALLFVYGISIHSQDTSNIRSSIADDLLYDGKIFLEDAGSYFTLPLRFDTNDWLLTAGLTGTTLLMISLDEEIKNKVGRNTISSFNDDFWDIGTSYGVVTYANLFSAGVYVTGLLSREDDVRVTGRLLLESLTYSGITVMIARYIAGRVRPYYNEGEWAFKGFNIDNEFQSFPSGHTVVAFALSTVLAERFDNLWARIGFYGLASITAFSRVYNNQHFFSDVVIGGLLGLGTGLFVVNRENERHVPENEQVKINLMPNPNGVSLLISF